MTGKHSEEFRAALREGELRALARVPKADLHCHSIFGTRIERVESWIHASLERPPARMRSLDEMRDYGHRVLYPHILSRAGFEFTAESAIRDALADGVVLLEMSLDVRFMSLYDEVPTGFLSFVRALRDSHAESIDFRPEIGVSKNRPPEKEMPLASACVDSGLFRSIDLYGNEAAQPPEAYRVLYRTARAHGLRTKAHVGEFGGADLMERTIDVLELDEVQHGIAAATSHALMDRLARGRIRLNVCPTSNVALGVARDMATHPVRALVDNGVRVSINTDDLTIFGHSISEQYLLLFRHGVLTAQEIDAIRQDSLSP